MDFKIIILLISIMINLMIKNNYWIQKRFLNDDMETFFKNEIKKFSNDNNYDYTYSKFLSLFLNEMMIIEYNNKLYLIVKVKNKNKMGEEFKNSQNITDVWKKNNIPTIEIYNYYKYKQNSYIVREYNNYIYILFHNWEKLNFSLLTILEEMHNYIVHTNLKLKSIIINSNNDDLLITDFRYAYKLTDNTRKICFSNGINVYQPHYKFILINGATYNQKFCVDNQDIAKIIDKYSLGIILFIKVFIKHTYVITKLLKVNNNEKEIINIQNEINLILKTPYLDPNDKSLGKLNEKELKILKELLDIKEYIKIY